MKAHALNLRAQALNMLAQGARKYMPAYILLPLVTVAVYWHKVPLQLLLGWLFASLLLVYLRYSLVLDLETVLADGELSVTGQQRIAGIETRAVRSSLYSGLLWGTAIFLFFDSTASGGQIYLLGTVFGLTSTALILCAWLPQTWYAFAVPVLGAMFARFLFEGSTQASGFAILTLLYFFVVMGVLKKQGTLAMESLTLRYENLELLEKLGREKEFAEHANLAKSKFLAAASHDLRQPMHSIGLFSSALENHTRKPEALRLINYIRDSLASLDNLLSVLLDISRLDAGVIVPRKTHSSLNALLQKIGNEYALQAHKKNLHWRTRIDKDIVVYTDEVLLETVLRNLLSNAIRYTESGSVEISATVQANQVHLIVKDTGVGIPLESQQAIFDEFFQVQTETGRKTGSVGLGLAIVKRLLAVLDYPLTLNSESDKGTSFGLHIPLGDPQRLETGTVLTEAGFSGAGMCVLVIDEDVSVLRAMGELLRAWSYTVKCVATATEALQLVKSRTFAPDLVISEYRFADNGNCMLLLQQLHNIASSPFETFVITGETSQQELRMLHASPYRVLHKPLKPAMLRACLRKMIKKPAQVLERVS